MPADRMVNDRRRYVGCTIGPKEMERLDIYANAFGMTPKDVLRVALNRFLNKVLHEKMPLEIIGKYAAEKAWSYPLRGRRVKPRSPNRIEINKIVAPRSTPLTLTKNQMQFLEAIPRVGDRSITSIGEAAKLRPTTSWQIATTLVERGWLKKKEDTRDPRRQLISTTIKARRLLATLQQ